MTKVTARLFLIVVLSVTVTACGNKGKLKTPSQAAAHEAKKAEKKAKQNKQPVIATPAADLTPPEEE
jgi:predicted small lipoprotein YifL